MNDKSTNESMWGFDLFNTIFFFYLRCFCWKLSKNSVSGYKSWEDENEQSSVDSSSLSFTFSSTVVLIMITKNIIGYWCKPQQSHRIMATLNHWIFVLLPFSLIEILPWMNWMTFLTCPQTQLCENCKLKAVALSTWGTLRRRRHRERHYAFLYTSLPLLHDWDEKLPSFTYDVITRQNFFFLNLDKAL